MKNFLIIIISVFVFWGCKKTDSKQVWIGTHYYNSHDSSFIDNLPRQIFYFENDSVVVKGFYEQFIGEDNQIYKYPYHFYNDDLVISFEHRTDTIPYRIEQNKMKRLNSNNKHIIISYQLLPTYNQVENTSKLYNELTSSTFEIVGDSLQIEFQDNHRFIKNKIDKRFGSNQLWMLDSFQNELFLVIDCSFNCSKSLFHITKIDKNSFEGVQYGKENKTYTFRKIPKQIAFNKHDLFGKWERFYDSTDVVPNEAQHLELPKSHPHYQKWYDKEQLIINDSTLVRYLGFRVDTVNWSMNREQEQMLFSEWKYSPSFDTRQWEIEALQKNELVIKRINRYFGDLKIETVKFIRK